MKYTSIHPGEIWLDTNGKPIQAHGFSVFYDEKEKTWYWYGENKEKTTGGPFNKIWTYGIRCYSSKDFYNWKDEGLIIPPSDDLNDPLHPTYCIDRPHIIYCEKTGKYVCWIKVMCGNVSQFMTVLQADSFKGPYTYVHRMYKPLSMDTGDFTLAKDKDTNKVYFIFDRPHFEIVTAELSDDYTSVTGKYSEHYTEKKPSLTREAPVFFYHNEDKWLITSGTSGYYPNPSDACLIHDWMEPYESIGNPCSGKHADTSFCSQFTCVVKIPGRNLWIAMADRWKPTRPGKYISDHYYKMVDKAMQGKQGEQMKPDYSPKTEVKLSGKESIHMENTSIARYVWLPMEWINNKPVIYWKDEWRIEDYA